MENDQILKVGVDPINDAMRLSDDYGLNVNSTFDLRFMAVLAECQPGTLAKMSEIFLDLKLKKGSDKALHFDWKKQILSEKQIEYAAKDVQAAIELFQVFGEILGEEKKEQLRIEFVISKYCSKFLDTLYNGAQGIPHDFIRKRMLNQ